MRVQGQNWPVRNGGTLPHEAGQGSRDIARSDWESLHTQRDIGTDPDAHHKHTRSHTYTGIYT